MQKFCEYNEFRGGDFAIDSGVMGLSAAMGACFLTIGVMSAPSLPLALSTKGMFVVGGLLMMGLSVRSFFRMRKSIERYNRQSRIRWHMKAGATERLLVHVGDLTPVRKTIPARVIDLSL